MKLSIIIPCFNEENTIELIIKKVINNSYNNKEIIIIDDYSSDKSRILIEKIKKKYLNIKTKYHDINLGKGACIRSGLSIVEGQIVLIQDSDLEYNPNEHIKLIEPILNNKADVVYGSRFRDKNSVAKMFFMQKFGNIFLTKFCNLFTKLNLTDMETCFKAFKTDLIKDIVLKENRFGIEPEITIKLSKKKCKFFEIPISYNNREYNEGKKINWKDGVSAIFCIIKYSLFDK